MTDPDELVFEVDAGAAHVTLNRPRALNALTRMPIVGDPAAARLDARSDGARSSHSLRQRFIVISGAVSVSP